ITVKDGNGVPHATDTLVADAQAAVNTAEGKQKGQEAAPAQADGDGKGHTLQHLEHSAGTALDKQSTGLRAYANQRFFPVPQRLLSLHQQLRTLRSD
ncbi:hypothetical protein, partial [Gibbsiella quercinecans]|uniref:hypothetical protein n=1 Tax=Gibbsiella quercinecans TaxID=929813 RepID=UPI001602AB2B